MSLTKSIWILRNNFHINVQLFFLLLSLFSCKFLFAQDTILQYQSLSQQWGMSNSSYHQPLFKITPYKPLYVLFVNYTNDINKQPISENPLTTAIDPLDFDDTEFKFQISFKTKALNNIFGKKIGGSLWGAYTQTSRWQLFNGELSRPFRETNYEPEIMLLFATPYKILGIKGVFAGIGINHQSNGRSFPYSRSWNRIFLQLGWEIKNLDITLRPWWRIREDFATDNNPGIESYLGKGELTLSYHKNRHLINITAKHSLLFEGSYNGGLQIDYSIRTHDNLKIRFQLYNGYGESLIDYNHKQTTVGIGISL